MNEFIAKQATFKKNVAAAAERFYKNKQTQEGYVAKARSAYEQDCIKINSYTAQCSIQQGRELESIQRKLERAQASIGGTEKEYMNFVRALSDTWGRWEAEWRTFCDRAQDLEEERIEFLKDNLWVFANAVSTVCVSDDEVSLHLPSITIFVD